MRRLAILLLCSCPPEPARATVRCLPRRTGISRRRRRATRTRRTGLRPATTRGETSSRRCSPPGRSARAVAGCAPTCSRAAGLRSRVPRHSTATAASAAWRRSHRFREPTAGVGPRRPDAGLARRLAAAAANGRRGRRDLGPRARLRTVCRVSGGLAVCGGLDGQARRARRRASVPHRSPSGAAGGTTCARSASGRRTWPRTGSPPGSATARSGTGCAGSE